MRPTDIQAVASELVRALRAAHDRPVVLLGYSLGALVAFEYARAMRMAGLSEPQHLFAIARRAPQLPVDKGISDLPRDAFIDVVNQRYGGIPAAIVEEPDLLDHYLPALRADLKLVESYRYAEAAPLACPITAISGDSDRSVTTQALEAWGVHTQGDFVCRQFEGGHFFAMDLARRRPLLQYVAARVT